MRSTNCHKQNFPEDRSYALRTFSKMLRPRSTIVSERGRSFLKAQLNTFGNYGIFTNVVVVSIPAEPNTPIPPLM